MLLYYLGWLGVELLCVVGYCEWCVDVGVFGLGFVVEW